MSGDTVETICLNTMDTGHQWCNQIHLILRAQGTGSVRISPDRSTEKGSPSWSEIQVALGETVSHLVFLSGNLDDNSNSKVGVINFPTGKTLGDSHLCIQGNHLKCVGHWKSYYKRFHFDPLKCMAGFNVKCKKVWCVEI